MQQFDFRRKGRKCSVSDREFEPGEMFHSALIEQADGSCQRVDIAEREWDGEPEHCIGSWKLRVPDLQSGQVYWAPRDVIVAFFEHVLADERQQAAAMVMSLLMQQKRMVVLKEVLETDEGESHLIADRKTNQMWEVPVVEVSADEASTIQETLAEQLFSDQPVVLDDEPVE